MNEDLLQYVWQQKILLKHTLQTSRGEQLQIIKPGELNRNAGPDFFHAQIQRDAVFWAGNIEIHIKSSDWIKHGHSKDPAYDNVILHVVWEHDQIIYNKTKEEIPTLELKDLLPVSMLDKYVELQKTQFDIACKGLFIKPPSEILYFWMERLVAERLEIKHQQNLQILKERKGHWEELFYFQLAHTFGQKINAVPFEILCKNLPYEMVQKNTLQSLSLQALVLGVAGFLNKPMQSQYHLILQREFNFLKSKYSLNTMDVSIWKFGKTRPANFPTIRLFQFAEIMKTQRALLQYILEENNIKKVYSFLQWDVQQKIEIGELHPQGKTSHWEKITLSKSMLDSLFINVFIPYLFSFGKTNNREDLCIKALDWLEYIPGEKNKIVEEWKNLGLATKKAKETQAWIQLKNYYCKNKRCLKCAIGNHLLKPVKIGAF